MLLKLHEWVHNNFLKYHLMTKIPLIIIVCVILYVV